METKTKLSAKQITGMAVLLALVVVLQAVVGAVPIGVVQLNFSLVPIVLGGMIYGAVFGAVIGLACGIIVLIQVITGTLYFYTLIWTGDPVVTLLTCLIKTTVAGFVGGVLYKVISKKNQTVATFVVAAAVPIINTAIFILGCLMMTHSVYAMAGTTNILVFILISIVSYNFFVELAINMVLAPSIKRVITAINR